VIPSPRLALPLAVLAWCALAIALLVFVMGPLAVPAIGLSISHPARLLVLSGVLACSALWCGGGIGALLDALAQSSLPYVATLVLVLGAFAALLSTHGVVSVGGADSAGYLAQAQRWREGQLHRALPLAIAGVDDPWVQTGLGLRPDASGTATVPTYPPGLPWLQAAALSIGGEFMAVRLLPAFAALTALLAAWCIAVPRTGNPGALLVVTCLATLPPFLYQALQPMSDVPALAAWLVALALASRTSPPAVAGTAAATLIAILIRPNLAPLVIAVLWQASLAAPGSRALNRRTILVSGAAGIAIVLVAVVQAHLYGSALQSGYGGASELFALTYVPRNLRLYVDWLREAAAWPARLLLAAGACGLAWSAWHRSPSRPIALIVVLTMALYLVYIPFDSWTYLRFVLVPLALAPLGAAYLVGLLQASRHARWTFPVVAALLLAVALPNLQRARDLTVFTVRAREYRYQAAGRFVRDHLPAEAVIVAVQHSASAPYYSRRPVIRPDLLAPGAFGAVVDWAARERRPLVFVLDEAEPAALRARFGDAGLTALDWPPRAEIGRPVSTRVWVAADRDAYLAGGRIRSTRITDVPRR
jgi:hypothetical protein